LGYALPREERGRVVTRGEILAERIRLEAMRLAEREALDLQIIANEHATRGMFSSGSNISQRHERRLRTLRTLLTERIRLEKTLPVAPEDEATWSRDLRVAIVEITDREDERILRELAEDCKRMTGGISEPISADAKKQLDRLRGEYLSEVDVVASEREYQKKIPPPPPAAPSNITINIGDHAQIAGLNVSGMVQSIQATVNNLQGSGGEQLAEALKDLTETIATEATLTREAKREALEQVSAIGEELARPPDQRRPSVLRSVANTLVGLIGHADKVYAVYEILKAVAKANGYDLP
jgi:hypothetical protein